MLLFPPPINLSRGADHFGSALVKVHLRQWKCQPFWQCFGKRALASVEMILLLDVPIDPDNVERNTVSDLLGAERFV